MTDIERKQIAEAVAILIGYERWEWLKLERIADKAKNRIKAASEPRIASLAALLDMEPKEILDMIESARVAAANAELDKIRQEMIEQGIDPDAPPIECLDLASITFEQWNLGVEANGELLHEPLTEKGERGSETDKED
jgi:hypothetical protein